MSDYSGQDPNDTFGERAGGQGQDASSQAGDLKGLLQRIADHIADADVRHGSVLRDMHDRLVHLGDEAHAVRDTVPPALSAAFARIESGIAGLAGRLESHDLSQSAPEAASEETDDRQFSFDDAGTWTGAYSGSQRAHDTHSPTETSGGGGHDYWDVTDSALVRAPGAPEHATTSPRFEQPGAPWDRDTAEALAQVYQDSAAHEHDGSDDAHQRAADDISGLMDLASASDPASIRPEDAIAALETRFQAFEDRVSGALEDVAKRSDVEGLRLIEAHITELSQHIDYTQSQLGRLDSIEDRLVRVMESISDERLKSLMAHANISDDELQRLTDALAERLDRNAALSDAASGSVATEKLDELRGMIEQFVATHQQADENTASVLTTVQQAMVHLLDRIDELEKAQTPWPAAGGDQDDDFFTARSDSEELLARVYHHQPKDPAPALPEDKPQAQQTPRAGLAEIAAEIDEARKAARDAFADLTDPAEIASEPDVRHPATDEREAFIASARRAARKASSLPPLASDTSALAASVAAKAGGRRKALARPVAGLMLAVLFVALATGVGVTTYSIIKPVPAKSAHSSLILQQTEDETVGAGEDAAERASLRQPNSGASDVEIVPATEDQAGESVPIGDEPLPNSPTLVREPRQQLPAGIMLETGAISADDVARAEQRRAVASLSTRLGAAQSNIQSIPTSLVPEAAPQQQSVVASTNPQSLPPAAIGPLSLRMAAANGDPSAEFEVADRFAEGKGDPQDFKQAVSWYQRSAGRGFAPAQYRLGTLYERGLGLKADIGRAKAWYRSAAEKGNIKAMHNLAVLSASATPSDYVTAAHWFTQAAERGVRDSQFNLAVLLESGVGVEQDLKAAYVWFSVAAKSGDKEAPKRMGLVKAKLQSGDISSADAFVRGWRPKPTDTLVNDALAAGEAWKRRSNDATPG